MDKTKLKNFAIEARENLIKSVVVELETMGINEEGISGPSSDSTRDMYIFDLDKSYSKKLEKENIQKYESLIRELKKREEETTYKSAYNNLVEEVAYTWFNRLIAIRFMEVNNYIPNKLRVLSSTKEGVREPELVEFFHDSGLDLKEADLEDLRRLRSDGSASSMDKIFKKLFIEECNYLNQYLPELFEKTDSYMDLLFNLSYNDPNSVVSKLVDLEEEIFNIEETGQIEIIGWMYQYYNSDLKAEVDKANKKVDKDTLPAKTQLFTPEWIVEYMVQNSLGRLWIEKRISEDDFLKEVDLARKYGWKYYLEEAEQEEEVSSHLIEERKERRFLNLEEITFMDPSMGSGHILVYAYDLLMELYLEEGYTRRNAAQSIIKNNLYGLDIDKRAYQLASFSLFMKAREDDRRILSRNIKLNLNYFIDSKEIDRDLLVYLGNEDKTIEKRLNNLLDLFEHAKELGSILIIADEYDLGKMGSYVATINEDKILPMDLPKVKKLQASLLHIIDLSKKLSNKYNIVVTNPPYLGRRYMSKNLTKYLDKYYKDTKSDLFAVFMEKAIEMLKSNSYYAMINQHSWMFLSSYEKYRENLLNTNTIINMLHLGPRSFEEISGEVVQSTAFVIKNQITSEYKASYLRLVDYSNSKEKKEEVLKNYVIKTESYYLNIQEVYKKIPGCPIAYWGTYKLIDNFEKKLLNESANPRQGLATTDNKKFLRLWNEIDINRIGFDLTASKFYDEKYKWAPHNKGGDFRRWYGNHEYIINWYEDGKEIKERVLEKYKYLKTPDFVVKNTKYYFKKSISWTRIGSGNLGVRYYPKGFIFDVAGSSLFPKENEHNYVLALMASKIAGVYLSLINPTLNFQVGNIGNIPYIFSEDYKPEIDKLVEENIDLSRIDWDSFETSWDFELHPLLDESKVGACSSIASAYEAWKEYANGNFSKLKENEERLNEIFIDIYGLNDELDKYILDKDITIAKIFDKKSDIYEDIKGNQYILTREDVVKSFISYAVGNMFGRYSLDEKGLVFAGGEFNKNRYKKYKPVEDNVLIISEDEYLEDDIVNRFIDFVRICFGEETLESNLSFIASELKGKNMTAREKIRNYFVKDFYKDHVKTYKKTPIYWMYDSGKQNGFKALIYLHRYEEDTTGIVRTDHLHRLQRAYEAHIEASSMDLDGHTGEEKKKIAKIKKQLNETRKYDEKLGHMALERIPLDLDDGVKVNYEKLQIDSKKEKHTILAKI